MGSDSEEVVSSARETETIGQDAEATSSPEITTCPVCGRKLLTRTSMLCNWCGAKINDPAYQAQAAETRHSLDETERARVEAIAQEEARYGVFGRLKRRAKQGPQQPG